MKKTFINSLAAMALLFGSSALTSCGSDGDGDFGSDLPGGPEAIAAVSPDKVFNNNPPTSIDGYRVNYDAAGRVTSIGSKCSFVYNTSTEKRASIEDCDVKMYVDGYTIYFCLNERGFIRYAVSRDTEWYIDYNSNDRISRTRVLFKDEDGDYEDVKLSYTGNNLTGFTGTSTEDGYTVKGSGKVHYTDNGHPDGVPNKDYYFFMDGGIGGYDFEELHWAYYAGMLGRGFDLLPLKLEQSMPFYESTEIYEWTLDRSGYPSSVYIEYKDIDDGHEETGSQTEYFDWN